MKILMTGGTGLVGRAVAQKLIARGHQIFLVTRDLAHAQETFPFPHIGVQGDLGREPLRDSRLKEIDAVIHLAGESVAEARWTVEKKNRIYNSRVRGTAHLLDSLQDAKLQAVVSTSASGYYGDRQDELLTENSPPGVGFLSQVCQDWERPILLAQSKRGPASWKNTRFVVFRVGMVLSSHGGALEKMLPPFRLGAGATVGSGKQWMSWIHLEDLSELYCQACENPKFEGIYNAVAPEPQTNISFSQTLGEVLHRKVRLSIPTFAVKAMFGEMAHVVLSSQRIEPSRLVQESAQHKFQFRFPHLAPALKDCVQ